ncbi:uncharacterized protein LOC135393004 [Ornithodoros turicata]|uniref:uncharacterized protein LOC135393004 n=1 Tax=Ornithodoros turicata TaxID=34597 RepID=UPI0031387BD7
MPSNTRRASSTEAAGNTKAPDGNGTSLSSTSRSATSATVADTGSTVTTDAITSDVDEPGETTGSSGVRPIDANNIAPEKMVPQASGDRAAQNMYQELQAKLKTSNRGQPPGRKTPSGAPDERSSTPGMVLVRCMAPPSVLGHRKYEYGTVV